MGKSQPTVSVVMATYNGERYIREQIDSILNQSYPICELIIQDDCSTDSTASICREYESRFPHIHFFVNDHNLGFNENFRTAVMRATGDLIAISDQDDVWFPQKIERQVAAIGDYDICTSLVCRGTTTEDMTPDPYSDDIRVKTHVFRDILGHTILAKRGFLQCESNWRGTFIYDWSLTLHADWGNGITKVNEPLVFHRSHEKSYTVIAQESRARGKSLTAAYIHGLGCLRRMQRMPKFISHCRFIQENTADSSDDDIRVQHRFAELLMSRSLAGLLRLCILCMRNRKDIYNPPRKAQGLMGAFHGFFFPLYYAYYCYMVFE